MKAKIVTPYRDFNDKVYEALEYLRGGAKPKTWVMNQARIKGEDWRKFATHLTDHALVGYNEDGFWQLSPKGSAYFQKLMEAKEILEH